jgi:hypothetical protein
MKFDGDPAALRHALEAAQPYRGLTFTDRGDLVLDVSNVKNGRVTLSQRGQRVSLLPESILGIQQAWHAGNIPLNGTPPWEISTFSAYDSEVDEVHCLCLAEEKIRISDRRNRAEISISKEQLEAIVDCIAEPWLANFPPAPSEVSPSQTHGRSDEIASPRAQATQGKRVPVADLS